MDAPLLILVGAVIAYAVIELVLEWRDRRRARLQEMARESWAIYHAARQIHDEAAVALQALLDESRRSRRES